MSSAFGIVALQATKRSWATGACAAVKISRYGGEPHVGFQLTSMHPVFLHLQVLAASISSSAEIQRPPMRVRDLRSKGEPHLGGTNAGTSPFLLVCHSKKKRKSEEAIRQCPKTCAPMSKSPISAKNDIPPLFLFRRVIESNFSGVVTLQEVIAC